jgi:subtilisin
VQRIVFLKRDFSTDALAAQYRAVGITAGYVFKGLHAVTVFAPEAKLALLDNSPAVLTVTHFASHIDGEPSVPTNQAFPLPFPTVTPDGTDSFAQECPTYDTRVGANLSHQASCNNVGSTAVKVAVIDTGISTHEDLNILGGASFENTPEGGSCVQGTGFSDLVGHGTEVAGVLAAKDNSVGYVGIAPSAQLYSARMYKADGTGTWSAMICALNWSVAQGIKIVNISSAGQYRLTDDTPGCPSTDTLHQAFCSAKSSGVMVVAGAGNSSANFSTYYPATFAEVMAATAMNDFEGNRNSDFTGQNSSICTSDGSNYGLDDNYASYSNWATSGSTDDSHALAAPGTCIDTTDRASSTSYTSGLSGTSFATPIITGVVALCREHGTAACNNSTNGAAFIAQLRSDASTYNRTTNPAYQYIGDPNHLIGTKDYNWLIYAGLY